MWRANKVTRVSHNPEEEPVSGPEQAEVPGQQPDLGQQQSLKVLGRPSSSEDLER